MRVPALAAGLLAVSACCLDVARDDACVVTRSPQPSYCFTLHQEDFVCWSDAGTDPAPVDDVRVCPGAIYRDESCEHLGFTVRCWDDYFVRPGDPCGW